MESPRYEVVRRDDGRYVVTDVATQEVLDNANGYGYKTRQNAEKAAWYKFKGGKGKKDAEKRAATAFWRQHNDFGKAVQDYYETWFKAIALGGFAQKVTVCQVILCRTGFCTKNGKAPLLQFLKMWHI